jgi:vesicle coat complex subunit
MGAAASEAAGDLVKSLVDTNSFVRWGCLRALAAIPLRKDKKETVGKVAELLKDKNQDVRQTAALVLQRYGPAAAPAAKTLAELANDKNTRMRLLAIQTLTAIGNGARKAGVPALLLALQDRKAESEVRLAAAQALARFGPLRGEALKVLGTVSRKDPDADVRLAAGEALLVD